MAKNGTSVIPSTCLVCGHITNQLIDSNGKRIEIKKETSNVHDQILHTVEASQETKRENDVELLNFFFSKMKLIPKSNMRWDLQSEQFPFCDNCKEGLLLAYKLHEELIELERKIMNAVDNLKGKMKECENNFQEADVYKQDKRYYWVRSNILGTFTTKKAMGRRSKIRKKGKDIDLPKKILIDLDHTVLPLNELDCIKVEAPHENDETIEIEDETEYAFEQLAEAGSNEVVPHELDPLVQENPAVPATNINIKSAKIVLKKLDKKSDSNEPFRRTSSRLTRERSTRKPNYIYEDFVEEEDEPRLIKKKYGKTGKRRADDFDEEWKHDSDSCGEDSVKRKGKTRGTRKENNEGACANNHANDTKSEEDEEKKIALTSKDPKSNNLKKPSASSIGSDICKEQSEDSNSASKGSEEKEKKIEKKRPKKIRKFRIYGVQYDEEKGKHRYMTKYFDEIGKNTFKCIECQEIIKKKEKIRFHVLKNHFTINCPSVYCNFVGRSISHCEDHYLFTHDEVESKRFACPICGKPNTKYGYVHFATHYNEEEKKEAMARGKLPNAMCPKTCNQCGKIIPNVHMLRTHMRKEHSSGLELPKEALFICPHCGKTFSDKSKMTSHVKVTHPNPEEWGALRYVCIYCDKRFVRKRHLENHKAIHLEDRPFACHKCPRKFKRKIGLDKHLNTHDNIRPFQCEHCPSAFTLSYHLRRHVAIYHLESSQPRRPCFVRGPGVKKVSST